MKSRILTKYRTYKKIKNVVLPSKLGLRSALPKKLAYKGLRKAQLKKFGGNSKVYKVTHSMRRTDKLRLRARRDAFKLSRVRNKYAPIKFRPWKKKLGIAPKIWSRLRRFEKERYKQRHKLKKRLVKRVGARRELKRKNKLGVKCRIIRFKFLLRLLKRRRKAYRLDKLLRKILLGRLLRKMRGQTAPAVPVVKIIGNKLAWERITAPSRLKLKNALLTWYRPTNTDKYITSGLKLTYFFRPSFISESSAIRVYSRHFLKKKKIAGLVVNAAPRARKRLQQQGVSYLKYLLFLRYRGAYRPKLRQFKLFKKFFKRTFKRYRRINKNRLFQGKLRQHLPKLTGYSEKALFKLGKPVRRSYWQYGNQTGAVQRFSQSILLMPDILITFLGLSPSRIASRYIIKSGAIFVNGFVTASGDSLVPGDIVQINVLPGKAAKAIFNYQKWRYKVVFGKRLSFLQMDYSAMMFMLLRWPRSHELIAPSFLTERGVRYYIRQFPARVRKFKAAKGNGNFYKKLPKR